MDQRDQELLEQQLRSITPARRNDATIVIVTVFLAGMALGTVLAGKPSAPIMVAANDAAYSSNNAVMR
jgi:hypothetical protein